MGKQAATRVRAGAEGTGTIREVDALPLAPKLELVDSPKREKILEGMLEAVGAEGYDAASVRTVLDRTGLYRQAFYDNFADKDSCYLAAFEAGVERLEGLVAKAAASEESWRGKLRSGLGGLLDYLDAEPDIGRGIIVEVHAAGPEALAKRAEAMKRVTDFIDLARAGGGRVRVTTADRPGGHSRRNPRRRPLTALHRGMRGLPRAAARVHVLRGASLLRRGGGCRGDAGRANLAPHRVGQAANPALHWMAMDSPSTSNPEQSRLAARIRGPLPARAVAGGNSQGLGGQGLRGDDGG